MSSENSADGAAHDAVTHTQFVKPGDYLGPDDPGYDRQVLRVSRQITFTSVVPITAYSGMDVPGAITHEHELDLTEVVELLQFIDERTPGNSVDLRTHVEVRRIVTDEEQRGGVSADHL